MKYEKSDKSKTNLYQNVLEKEANFTFAFSPTKVQKSKLIFGYI